VYDAALRPLLAHIFAGTQATVFAFGQTGSGKTCTMAGHGDASLDDGNALGLCAGRAPNIAPFSPARPCAWSDLAPRRCRYALAAADVMAEAETRELSVGISFYEVYRGQASAYQEGVHGAAREEGGGL
jgi:hypothetical protein